MQPVDETYPLTVEQFERLVALIDAAAKAAVFKKLHQDPDILTPVMNRYEAEKEAARRVLVGGK